MGFGGIISTGLSIATLLIAGYMILAGMSYTLNAGTASAAAVREIKADQLNTMICISNVTSVDSSTLTFNVTDNGSTAIDDVSRMDVILKYVDQDSGQCIYAAWLKPGEGPVTGAGRWYSTGIVSPMRNTTGTVMLLPGETMKARAVLSAPQPADAGVIEASAPNGVSATLPFNFRI